MRREKEKAVRERIVHEIYTYCAFCIAISAIPALAISFIILRLCKQLWLKLLSSRYPHLEFIKTDTIRSLLDTHRNQGIINVLLSVNGAPDIVLIRRYLTEHVLERLDSNGEYMFPRLRHHLVSCWGNYAWDDNAPFKTENHFTVANGVYRGRTVNENNIQDYVSEIVSKYFPSDQPPWQYIIIPCASNAPKYYILVRVHHLLLTGKKSINIGDLLLVEQNKSQGKITVEYNKISPLLKLLPTPTAIPELWEKINEMLSNAWNEFVSEYDPVESPRAMKTLPGMFHVAGLVLLSTVSSFRELTKKTYDDRFRQDGFSAKQLLKGIKSECKRRNLTVKKTILSPIVTFDPRKWPKWAFGTFATVTRAIIKLPIQTKDEILALKELRDTGHVSYPKTMTWKYAGIAQLSVKAFFELCRGIVEVYRAPATIWDETIGADDGERHLLQTVSLCGRKVATWSRSVSRASIDRAARALGMSTTEVTLYAAAEALKAFFEITQATSPDHVLATARAATQEFLFTFAEGNGKRYKKTQAGGMICLGVPLHADIHQLSSSVQETCARQATTSALWVCQARCGALTRALPSPLARLTLNLLSRRFALSYTEINAPPDAGYRKTVWGQTIDAVLYWRPPQANISMSLTVIQYADTIRLAVMTDSRLSPHHVIPATKWTNAMEQIMNKVDQQLGAIAQKPPSIVTSNTEDLVEEEQQFEPSTSRLRPPITQIVSPPPIKRNLSYD